MNTDLNEKLSKKKYQRNYYTSKKIKKILHFCIV